MYYILESAQSDVYWIFFVNACYGQVGTILPCFEKVYLKDDNTIKKIKKKIDEKLECLRNKS